MQRLRFYDLRKDRLPDVVGKCEADIHDLAKYVNSAQRRLLMCREAGDEGWWGTWAEMAFTVSRTSPYLTVPRQVARLQKATVCEAPIGIANQFYEYLDFGNGRLPKTYKSTGPCVTAAYTRNNVPTFRDLSNAPQIIRIYLTEEADANKRVLLQGTDSNGKVIYTMDTYNPTNGLFVICSYPFTDAGTQFNTITGIQKDVTLGTVEIKQVDPTTGAEVTLVTMEPSEETASYRRYYFDSLPRTCCPPSTSVQNLTITAICKLDLIPVRVDTDYTLIQNREAIIDEAASIRHSEMDSSEARQLCRENHRAAIGWLNGELAHYLGKDTVAVGFKPFGSADLRRRAVGNLF